MIKLPQEIEKAMQEYEKAVIAACQPVQVFPGAAHFKIREWERVNESKKDLEDVILKHIDLAWNYNETENRIG